MPALQENNRFIDAADLVQYFHPHSFQLIKVLCDGQFYQKAIFESASVSELPNDFVRNDLNEFASRTIDEIQADQAQFKAFVGRLQTIRKEKADKLLNGDVDDDDCDMFSDTTSMNSSRFSGSSRGTGRTFRSSKSKRRHERKLLSLKEGNPFEDIALIDAIFNFTDKIYAQQQKIHNLLRSLVDLELDIVGIQLQKVFSELLDDIKRSLDIIWLPEMMVSGEIKVEEFMDYVRAQNEQHYAMISECMNIFIDVVLIETHFMILTLILIFF